MVNRSKPKWWKWSERSYWYVVIGINAAVILIAVSAFYLGFTERFPIVTLLGIPILFLVIYTPKRFLGSIMLVLIFAAPGYMIGLFVSLFVFEINPFPGVALGFILGGTVGYLVGRRMKWHCRISPAT